MKDYKLGEIYPFVGREIITHRTGQNFIQIQNPEDEKDLHIVPAFDFQLDKDYPVVVMCEVISVEDRGGDVYYKWRQCMDKILNEVYPKVPTDGVFKPQRIEKDNNDKEYYVLKDGFGLSHRIYKNGVDLPIDENVDLTISEIKIKGNGKAFLELKYKNQNGALKLTHQDGTINIADRPVCGIFGRENDHTEFKTSVVFSASNSEANIDQQLNCIIMKTIAGFMNKNGGRLYIGVNDHGVVTGLANDYINLNTSKKDKFEYGASSDQFELKIRNTMYLVMGTKTVGNYVTFNFEKLEDLEYCIVDIKRAETPVYINGEQIFQRMGNQTNRLRGEEITNFFKFRYNLQIPTIDVVSTPDNKEDYEAPEINASDKYKSLETELEKRLAPKLASETETPWKYVRLYKEGKWSFGGKPTENRDDLVHEIVLPIERNDRDNVLMLCYKNGYMASVKLKDVKPKDAERIYSNGWHSELELVKAFVSTPHDLIAFRLKETRHGYELNKCHYADDFGIQQKMGGQGNAIFSPQAGVELVDVEYIPSKYAHLFASWIVPKSKRTMIAGYERCDSPVDTLPLLDGLFER